MSQEIQKAHDFSGHVPKSEKHPQRHGIHGKKHLIPELKKLVEEHGCCPKVKEVIHAELDKMKSAAAELDLHVIDHPHGDVSIHIHIKPIHLG